MKPSSSGWSRRTVLGAALAAPALLIRSARAAPGEIVLMMSGGSFMTTWQSQIIDPFEKATGLKVRMTPGNNKAQAMALRANPSNPAFDVYLGNGDDFLHLLDAGLIVKLAPREVPNLAKIYPKFRDRWEGYGSHFDYSSVGIAYRPDRIKSPPGSWREFIDRTATGEFGSSVFLPSMAAGVRGPEVLVTISRALSGNGDDVDAGFAALKRMKPYVFKYYTSFNDPAVLLLNDEGAIGTGWDGRSFIAHDESGGKVDWIKPREGAASSGPVIAVVKGGNEEGATKLLNWAIGAAAQKPFCEAMFYGSVNSEVRYSDALAKRIPAVDDINVPDDRFLGANLSAWIERWNRDIAS
jgi:putative spermidine/putrescine transport system substrate-binding protein